MLGSGITRRTGVVAVNHLLATAWICEIQTPSCDMRYTE